MTEITRMQMIFLVLKHPKNMHIEFLSISEVAAGLGWEFQFSVPISGTPIGSGIPIPFLIPKILVGFFSKFRC
jgi:hypothetical protein